MNKDKENIKHELGGCVIPMEYLEYGWTKKDLFKIKMKRMLNNIKRHAELEVRCNGHTNNR